MSVADAFETYRSNLEITKTEQAQASSRQQAIRAAVCEAFEVEDTFLTGSYARYTKTKPLKDVDIFCVLTPSVVQLGQYRNAPPAEVLHALHGELQPRYPRCEVSIARRAVTMDFGAGDDIMSFDIVPGFVRSAGGYEIPDCQLGCWVATDPSVHAELAKQKNQEFDGKWKPLIKMIKGWNRHAGKDVHPSFLIEVMGLVILRGAFVGYPTEIRGFFATASEGVMEDWADPAGLGPDVNDNVTAEERAVAASALSDALAAAVKAQRLEQEGREREAMAAWRDLLGPLFPAN